MTGRRWEIRIPAPIRIVSVNGESGHAVSRNRKTWRETAFYWIGQHRDPNLVSSILTGLDRIRVDIEIRCPTSVRRDESNYNNVCKPILDAIGPELRYMRQGKQVFGPGHGIIADDSGRFLHCSDCPHITFGAPTGRYDPRWPYGLVTVTITDLSERVQLLDDVLAERFGPEARRTS